MSTGTSSYLEKDKNKPKNGSSKSSAKLFKLEDVSCYYQTQGKFSKNENLANKLGLRFKTS